MWLYFKLYFFYFYFYFLRQVLCISLSWNSLCRPGCPWTHRDLSVSATPVLGLKVSATTPWIHRGLSASASQTLGLKACATIPWTHRDLSVSASQALGLKPPHPTTLFFSTLRTLTFSLQIFLTHCKPFRGFLHLWMSLYCISLFFLTTWVFNLLSNMERIKAVAFMAGSAHSLAF